MSPDAAVSPAAAALRDRISPDRGGARRSVRRSRPRLLLGCLGAALLLAAAASGTARAQRITILRDEGDSTRAGRDVLLKIEEQEARRARIDSVTEAARRGADSLYEALRPDWDARTRPRAPRRSQSSTGEIVAFGQDVVVPEEKTVQGDVVSILGSVRVEGMVQGSVVSLGGDVEIGPMAVVEGDAISIGGSEVFIESGAVVHGEAVAVGGRINQEPHARVGERIQISFIPAFGRRAPFFFRAGWGTFFAHLILIGLVGLVFVKLGSRRWHAAVATLKARGWESLLAGVGAGIVYAILGIPLMLVIILALIALVVGIPLVPLVIFLLLVFPGPGYVVTAALVGGAVRRAPEHGAGTGGEGMGGAFLLGHLILTIPWFLAVFSHSALGASWFGVAGIFLLAAWGILLLGIAFGWGAFLLSRFGKRFPPVPVPAAGSPQVPVPSP